MVFEEALVHARDEGAGGGDRQQADGHRAELAAAAATGPAPGRLVVPSATRGQHERRRGQHGNPLAEHLLSQKR
jgi:hypothetical protein